MNDLERTRWPGVFRRQGKRGTTYRAFAHDVEGKQIAATFKTIEAARRWKHKAEASPPAGVVDPSRTLRDVYEAQGAGRDYAAGTWRVRAPAWAHLERLAEKPIERISRHEVDRVVEAVKGPQMRRRVRSLLSTLFAYAISEGWTQTNPAMQPPRKRTRAERLATEPTTERKRYLSHEELALLEDEIEPRYRALIELGARLGLRPGELFALRVGKFDPMHRTLTIDTSETGFTKTGETRTLRLPSSIVEVLVQHVEQFSSWDPDALMFTSAEGKAISSTNFRDRNWARARRRAGLEGFSPNMLRHTAASFAISTGANVYDVQRMLGHAKASITLDVYGELYEQEHTRFIDRYDEAIREARAGVRGQ